MERRRGKGEFTSDVRASEAALPAIVYPLAPLSPLTYDGARGAVGSGVLFSRVGK